MSSRYPTATLALAVVAAALSGCAPAPEPTPTPTPAFASEEEAFAAAEEVYREYNEAVTARIAGASTPDPQDYLIGSALEADIDTLNLFNSRKIHLEGTSVVASFSGESADLSTAATTVVAAVCLDATRTRVVTDEGADVTPKDRPETSLLRVTFVSVDGRYQISNSELPEDPTC